MAERTQKPDDDSKVVVPVETTPAKPHAVTGKTIEDYRDELGTDPATFAGVKARERWPNLKRVTKHQYEKAVERFLTGPTVQRGGE